jgi:serine/threonine protein kinase
MSCADRDLDAIFRSERPSHIKIRDIAKDIADAIAHVHKNGMIHGDVKLLNAVRVGTRLRLIDFDASITIGKEYFGGAKFSSGILPPEMIAELTLDDYKKYNAYYQTNVSAASPEKIKPKAVTGSNTIFAVKTFLTKPSKKGQFDLYGEVVWRICQEPVEREDLPYKLVKATAAIDIWSFGAVLYELHTGETLFAVNRDNDLKDGASMKELCEWDDTSKLRKVSDLSAHGLLKKVLSADPNKRYETMEKLLEDGYFTAPNAAEALEVVVQKVTMKMAINTEKVKELIKMSTSVLCNAIFEATEVDTPSCFIILPEEIAVDSESGDDVHWGNRFEYIQEVLDKASSCITAPFDFALGSINEQFLEKPMFLYLVDEYTGEPVVTKGGAYPIKINVRSEKAKKFLPVMAVGMKAVAVANTAAGLIAMFYPGVPQIPLKLIEKAKKFVSDSKRGVIEQALHDTTGVRDGIRGNALREFGAFLKETDADSTFSGLKRLCDESSGRAIWVTEESAQEIELENGSSTNETDEVKKLKAENTRLVGKQEKLVEEKKKLKEANADSTQLKAENTRLVEEKNRLVEEKNRHEEANSGICCVLM